MLTFFPSVTILEGLFVLPDLDPPLRFHSTIIPIQTPYCISIVTVTERHKEEGLKLVCKITLRLIYKDDRPFS